MKKQWLEVANVAFCTRSMKSDLAKSDICLRAKINEMSNTSPGTSLSILVGSLNQALSSAFTLPLKAKNILVTIFDDFKI